MLEVVRNAGRGGQDVSLDTRKGDFIQTYLGIAFWPMDARKEEVKLIDIAHALSNTCRFGGHSAFFYSVAQHSVLVSRNCKQNPEIGLMHDATEAYLVDVPTPIKRFLTNYYEIERGLAKVIGDRFGLVLDGLPDEVVDSDARALWTEKRDLRGPSKRPWTGPRREPWPERISPWTPTVAKKMFLETAEMLGITER